MIANTKANEGVMTKGTQTPNPQKITRHKRYIQAMPNPDRPDENCKMVLKLSGA